MRGVLRRRGYERHHAPWRPKTEHKRWLKQYRAIGIADGRSRTETARNTELTRGSTTTHCGHVLAWFGHSIRARILYAVSRCYFTKGNADCGNALNRQPQRQDQHDRSCYQGFNHSRQCIESAYASDAQRSEKVPSRYASFRATSSRDCCRANPITKRSARKIMPAASSAKNITKLTDSCG